MQILILFLVIRSLRNQIIIVRILIIIKSASKSYILYITYTYSLLA